MFQFSAKESTVWFEQSMPIRQLPSSERRHEARRDSCAAGGVDIDRDKNKLATIAFSCRQHMDEHGGATTGRRTWVGVSLGQRERLGAGASLLHRSHHRNKENRTTELEPFALSPPRSLFRRSGDPFRRRCTPRSTSSSDRYR